MILHKLAKFGITKDQKQALIHDVYLRALVGGRSAAMEMREQSATHRTSPDERSHNAWCLSTYVDAKS
eukprot:6188379-Pleurochrysis_carterae.AAC.2